VKRLWRSYNLSVVLGLLVMTSWVGQFITQWFMWAKSSRTQPAAPGRRVLVAVLGEHPGELAVGVPAAVQLRVSFVALSALFIHRASAESKDSDEQTQQSIAMHWCSRWLAT
jgi:hypothetical protein